MKNPNKPCVYILTNWNKTVLYIGVTGNLTERLAWHMSPKIKSFTTKYNVQYLIYFDTFKTMRLAIDREKQIKGWTRIKKEDLIKNFNPHWEFISHTDPYNFHSERSEESITHDCQIESHSEEHRDEGPSPLSEAKGRDGLKPAEIRPAKIF